MMIKMYCSKDFVEGVWGSAVGRGGMLSSAWNKAWEATTSASAGLPGWPLCLSSRG